jgi:hypothetical protein
MRHHVRAGILVGMLACSFSFTSNPLDAQQASIPDAPLAFGAFSAQFRGDGTFSLAGEGWPSMQGAWTINGSEMELRLSGAPPECAGAALYTVAVNGQHVTFALVTDACVERRMILDRSEWRPASEAIAVPERRIVRTVSPGNANSARGTGRELALVPGTRRPVSPTASGS